MKTYTTKQIACQNGIHPNTVRFYEQIGFITSPVRAPNGYRIYTDLQLEQCGLVRLAMRASVLQSGLRKKAVEIVKRCAAQDVDAALTEAKAYQAMIAGEIRAARAAVASVEKRLAHDPPRGGDAVNRREAARRLRVTGETLRTWERSGLITVGRGANGYRVYSRGDMERLNIIRTLRCANYSLTAILRLLRQLDGHAAKSVEDILNTPDDQEDIVSVCDHLIVSLQSVAADADEIVAALRGIREKFYTLQ